MTLAAGEHWEGAEEVGLLRCDLDDVDFGDLDIPVAVDVFEDEAELAILSGGEGCGGDGLGVDVGLVGADEQEREGFDLGGEAFVVAEEHLDGDGGDGLGAGVS